MRIRVSIFPGVKAGYRAFVSGWTRLALKFKRRVSAGDWDSPRPHSLFVFFSASSSGWSSVFGSMLLIDCVLRSLIVCCGRGWWLQKLLLSTDLLQVILTAMFSWARGSWYWQSNSKPSFFVLCSMAAVLSWLGSCFVLLVVLGFLRRRRFWHTGPSCLLPCCLWRFCSKDVVFRLSRPSLVLLQNLILEGL